LPFHCFFICRNSISYQPNDKNSVYAALNQKYANLQSISFKFNSSEIKEMNGTLKAQKGNKYSLQVGSRNIVSMEKLSGL